MWYDKQGNPLTDVEANKLLGDFDYKVIKHDTLNNGRFVSTVWLGLDYGFSDGPPLIFETMVFPEKGNWMDEHCERYATEEEARAGHERIVREWSDD